MTSSHLLAPLGAALLVLGSGCTEKHPQPGDIAPWTPELSYVTPAGPTVRGFLDRRGLIHAHSVFSHDACDGEPFLESGERDPVCFDDFRRGLCQARHDFVFLTDHPDNFADGEFPDTLLYREERGDELIDRGDGPVANWTGDCLRKSLIIGGYESETMGVGIEGHAAETPEARKTLYGSRAPEDLDVIHELGGLVILQHTEDETAETLADPNIDGFEMYNLHANTFLGAGPFLEVAVRISQGDTEVAHPDLLAMHIISEDERYLSTWAAVLSAGHRKVTTMGTDCHRNSLPGITEDGERIDSYRRMMRMFSNHLLVRPDEDGSYDDRHLKEALAAGRLYGAFELMGYPVGFDYRADTDGDVVEMGSPVSLSDNPTLEVVAPTVENIETIAPEPLLTVRILRAVGDAWIEVATAEGDLSFTPQEPGAYRAEVRMIPYHLAKHLRADAKLLLGWRFQEDDATDWVWIYSNPIYIEP